MYCKPFKIHKLYLSQEYDLVSGDDVEGITKTAVLLSLTPKYSLFPVPNKYAGAIADDGSLKGKLLDSHGEGKPSMTSVCL